MTLSDVSLTELKAAVKYAADTLRLQADDIASVAPGLDAVRRIELELAHLRTLATMLARAQEGWLVNRYGDVYADTKKPLANDGRACFILPIEEK